MSGAGGIKAAMYVAEVAPRDGTILTIVSQGLAADQGLGLNPSLQADLRDFNWVGNLSSAGQVVVTWHTSPTRTLADAMTRPTVMGVTGAGSITLQLGAVLNNVIPPSSPTRRSNGSRSAPWGAGSSPIWSAK
jgi:hypothetical protein